MRNLLNSVKILDLVKCFERGRKTTMKTENLILHNRCEWEQVEKFSEELPHIGISILSLTLIIEAIHLRDLPTLMISSENSDSVSVSNLKCDEESHRLYRVVSSVNVVSHK